MSWSMRVVKCPSDTLSMTIRVVVRIGTSCRQGWLAGRLVEDIRDMVQKVKSPKGLSGKISPWAVPRVLRLTLGQV